MCKIALVAQDIHHQDVQCTGSRDWTESDLRRWISGAMAWDTGYNEVESW